MDRRRTLIRTAVLSAVALAAFAAHRYVLPSIGVAERGPVPIGTIARLAAPQPGPEALVAAFAGGSEALAATLTLAGSEMSRLPVEAVARLRARTASAPDAALATASGAQAGSTGDALPHSLPQALPQALPKILPDVPPTGRAARPSPADADPLRTLPDLGCTGVGCTVTPRLADPDVTGTIAARTDDLAAPTRQTRVFTAVDVVDGRTFRAAGATVRLANLSLPDRARRCRRLDGAAEPCVERTRTRLDLITRHRPVTCDLDGAAGGAGGVLSGACRIGEADLSLWLIREGWALPSAETPATAAALAEARRLRAGLWR